VRSKAKAKAKAKASEDQPQDTRAPSIKKPSIPHAKQEKKPMLNDSFLPRQKGEW
jgi:hypothetical protein